MFDALAQLLDTTNFPPRWNGGSWTPALGWLYVLSDLGVWSAYVAILGLLVGLAVRRRDIPFRPVFFLFAAFILACGATHLMEAALFWWPAYRLAGMIKLATALVSWATVAALVPVVPKVAAMRGPEELEREIADRKAAEGALQRANAELERRLEALRASEERFRLLVDGARDHAIFMLDSSGRIASWNTGAERIKQFRAEEIIGQHFSRFYTDEDVRSGKSEDELRIAAAEGRCEDEGWRLRKDGSRFWANVVITALRGDGGELRGFSKIIRDMTGRRQAEENARRLFEEEAARRAAEEHAAAIWQERERLRVTLQSIGDGVITTDADGRVTLLNPVAESLTGWTNADAAGRPLRVVFRIVGGDTRQEIENPAARVLRVGVVVGLADHTVLISRDGVERPIDDTAAPIKDDEGKLVGVVLVFRDATERRATDRRRAARLAVTQTLAEVDTIDEAVPRILRALCDDQGWKVGSFWLADPTDQRMRCLRVWRPPSADCEGYDAACRRWAFPRGEGLPGRVWASGRPVWIPDMALDPMSPRAAIADRDGLHAAFGFPITGGDHVLGVIELLREEAREPDADLIEMTTTIGALIAQFLERQRAELGLRREREWFRTTLASIADGVITADTQGRVTYLNPVAEALTAWSREQAAAGTPLGSVFRIIDEESRLPVEDPAVEALRPGRTVGLANQSVLIARDGGERPIDYSVAPIENEHGEAIGIILVFRDVTERRRAEQRIIELNRDLRRRVTEFQTLLEVLPVSIAVADDPECRRIWSNPAMSRLLQLPADANVSLSAPAEERPGIRVYQDGRELSPDRLPMQLALSTGQPVHGVKQDLLLPDGSWASLLQYAVPLRDERGGIRGGLYVGVDVTGEERTQRALREAERRWRTLTAALPNLVWTDLPDGQCDWLSSQWRTYTGIPEEELLGLRWLETVIHPDDRERTLACWTAACEDRGDYDLEYRIRRHDGEYRWFKTRGVPIRDDQGKIVYWFGTCTDIEDVKRMESALREADRRKNEFLATLAHELRNPLAPLRTGLQVLRLTEDREECERAMGMMERQLAQMVRLIDDLLDVSRISRNRLELRRAPVPLASVVENAVETARPLIDAKGHALTVSLPPGPVILDADLTRLAQVFWNLLNNSAKYTDPGGRIDLSAQCRDDEVVVTVRDTGIGIPPEAMPGLFTLFSQVDYSLERSQGGLGIGLALVKGLVEMHGGDVRVQSGGRGRGSEFVVRLPLAHRQVPPADESPPSAAPAASRRRRILVVDDNRDGAASLGMMLSLLGHDTRTAHDGLEAVELAEAFRPDVMLLDIGLPKINGYDACCRIRREPWGKGIFIVAVTGWGQEDDRRRSREAGFDHHMVKPIDLPALERLLAGMVEEIGNHRP